MLKLSFRRVRRGRHAENRLRDQCHRHENHQGAPNLVGQRSAFPGLSFDHPVIETGQQRPEFSGIDPGRIAFLDRPVQGPEPVPAR